MIAALVLHAIRVFVSGAYKRPREFTWILGVLLLGTTLGLAFTGSILPWNQVSFWGTTIATEMAGGIPWIGPEVVRALRGSEDVSDATLGRFFALHVAILPAGLLALVAAHLALVRKHGLVPPESVREERERGHLRLVAGGDPYWPIQALREVVTVSLLFAGLVVVATLVPETAGEKADPFSTPPGIRPAWYFLPLYQLQKFIPSEWAGVDGRTIGFLVQGLGAAALLLLPFLDRNPERRASRRWVAIAGGIAVASGLGLLGFLGAVSDRTIGIGGRTVSFDFRGLPTASSREVGPVAGETPTATVAAAGRERERCVECHPGATSRHEAGVHGGTDVACVDCHGGDPRSIDERAAHEGEFDGKPGLACETCHAVEAEAFLAGPHGEAYRTDALPLACGSCHGHHEVRNPGHSGLGALCRDCHDRAPILERGAATGEALLAADRSVRSVGESLRAAGDRLETSEERARHETVAERYRTLLPSQHRLEWAALERDAAALETDAEALAAAVRARAAAFADRTRALPWAVVPLALIAVLALRRLRHLRSRSP
jgi:hypothetical protein